VGGDLEDRLRGALAGLAASRRTLTYRDAASLLDMEGPRSIHRLTQALEQLVREDRAAGAPLLAALVVGRGALRIPRPGFFLLLAELGAYGGPPEGPEAARFHAAELERAWDHWARTGSSGRPRS